MQSPRALELLHCTVLHDPVAFISIFGIMSYTAEVVTRPSAELVIHGQEDELHAQKTYNIPAAYHSYDFQLSGAAFHAIFCTFC